MLHRENRRLARLLKAAKLRVNACVEDIDYRHPRGLEKARMAALASGDWIRQAHNLCITGPTGCGKTWLACALGNQACRQGLSVRYLRLPALFEQLRIAHGDGSWSRLMNRLLKMDLLILDDWGLQKITERGRREIDEQAAGLVSRGGTTPKSPPLAKGIADDPAVDLRHQVVALCGGYEAVGGDDPTVLLLHTHQELVVCGSLLQALDALPEEQQAVIFQCTLDALHPLHFTTALAAQFLVTLGIYLQAIAAPVLGRVTGHVRHAQQCIAVMAAVDLHQADAGPHVNGQ